MHSLTLVGLESAAESLTALLSRSRAESTLKAYATASSKRIGWIESNGLADDGKGFLVYLTKRAGEVGASALAKEIAAFGFATGESRSPELEVAKLMTQGFSVTPYPTVFRRKARSSASR